MKLLIYSHVFAPQVGGVETFTSHLAQGLSSGDENSPPPVSVTVVTQTPGAHNDTLPQAGFHVVRRPRARKLWSLIANADTVLLAGPAILPLLFSLIQRKRVLVTHHGYQSICPNGMLFHFPTRQSCPGHFAAGRYSECVKCNRAQDKLVGSTRLLLLTFVRRLLSCLADSNVAVSHHVLNRIALRRALVIRNGVPAADSRERNIASRRSGAARFAYVGRLVTEKGVQVLIDAAGILKERGTEFQVLIVGDGPEREALQGQLTRMGLAGRLEFLGFLTGAKLEEALRGTTAIIMPSIWEEAAPLSALEQMVRGRLIIASNLGGLAEEIGDAGITFTPGSARELADQMERVISERHLPTRLGAQARDRALRNYTLPRMLSEYRDLLHRDAPGGKSSPGTEGAPGGSSPAEQ